MTSPYVLPFAAATPDDETRLGGKSGSLARLIRAGAPVPPGFAVTTDAYASMLALHGLRERVDAILHALPRGDVTAQADAA